MIDFTTYIVDHDGKPLEDAMTMQANGGGTRVDLTLGRAAAHALMVQAHGDPEITGEEKFHRGMLACKVRDCAGCNLKAEDIVLIKQQLAKLYSPLVIYRAYLLLDGAHA